MRRNILIAIAAAAVLVGTIWFLVTKSGPASSPSSGPGAASTPYETDSNLAQEARRLTDLGRVGGSAQKRLTTIEKLEKAVGFGSGGSSGGSGGSSSGGGGGGFKVPQNKGELILLILSVVLIVIGCYLIKQEPPNLKWGFGLLVAGIAALLFQIGVAGLNFNLNPWSWPKTGLIVWLTLVVCWTTAKITKFTKIDDWVVTLGSIGMFILSIVGGVLGAYNPFTPQWWALELLWIFLIAEAILEDLAARRTLQILLLAAGWYILGVIS